MMIKELQSYHAIGIQLKFVEFLSVLPLLSCKQPLHLPRNLRAMKQSRPVEGGNKVSDAPREKQGNRKGAKSSEPSKNTNDGARAKQATLKTVLGEALGYGPALSEHIILDAGLIPNTKVTKDSKFDFDTIQRLAQSVAKFENWLEDVILGDQVPEGYILMQNKIFGKDCPPSQPDRGSQIYDEFCPILLNQFKSREFVKFETFDAALDEFYSKIEGQRSEQQQKAKEENRVHTLKKEDDRCIKMAELIEYNLEDVDAAILAVRVALANGMNWEDLARMVKEKKKSGNPVAGLIDKLYLERNCMTLLLSNNLDEMDDDEKTLHVDKVEVDLALSAHANARRWYEQKKRQENKREKTIIAHEKLLKLLKRRLASSFHRYIHADPHGASSTVIKNHKPEHPVPPLTLNQAGCFTVCHSQVWDSKIVTSAWWVYPHQVSKTAPTGEYLTVGSFMIHGKKNFLPPHPLMMGFGLLFCLDERAPWDHIYMKGG